MMNVAIHAWILKFAGVIECPFSQPDVYSGFRSLYQKSETQQLNDAEWGTFKNEMMSISQNVLRAARCGHCDRDTRTNRPPQGYRLSECYHGRNLPRNSRGAPLRLESHGNPKEFSTAAQNPFAKRSEFVDHSSAGLIYECDFFLLTEVMGMTAGLEGQELRSMIPSRKPPPKFILPVIVIKVWPRLTTGTCRSGSGLSGLLSTCEGQCVQGVNAPKHRLYHRCG